MLITWTASPAPSTGTTPLVLGNDDLPKGPGMRLVQWTLPRFTRLTQTARPVRAAGASHYDRKNIETTYRFQVHYQFTSAGECQAWLQDLGARLYGRGVLRIVNNNGSIRTMTAVWDDIQAIEHIGVFARVIYAFRGGQLGAVAGAGPINPPF